MNSIRKLKIPKNIVILKKSNIFIIKNKDTQDFIYLSNTFKNFNINYNSLTHTFDILFLDTLNYLNQFQIKTFYISILNNIKDLSNLSDLLIKRSKKYIKTFNIPDNINLYFTNNVLKIQNKENLKNELSVILPSFFDYLIEKTQIKININDVFLKYQMSKALFKTITTKLVHQLKGVSELYRGVINIQGLGYSVAVTKLKNGKYNLFFRFGFKDKFNYIMPDKILIENPDTAKTKLLISTFSLELLKQTQLNIQRFRYPKAYKLQGIYLNDTFPKVKKFVK